MKTNAHYPGIKLPWMFALLAAMVVFLAAGSVRAACYPTQADADAAGATTVRIYGSIYTGGTDATTGEGLPAPGAGAINDATVMVQNMHHGGPVECYASVTPGSNTYEAFVTEDEEYVVMFGAPGHDVTSREFTIPASAAADILAGTILATDFEQDAFLPPRDAAGELPTANLLVYAFNDKYVNSEDDYPDDPALAGVRFYVFDEDGNWAATGESGTQTEADMPAMFGPDLDGLYYFTGLKPGEYYVMAVPPGSSVGTDSLGNPVMNCEVDPHTADWLHMTSEEGSQCWEVILRPNDPGTELGAYIAWFGFAENLGQLPPFVATETNPIDETATISGTLWDADGTDPFEVIDVHEVPQVCSYATEGTLCLDYTTGYDPDLGREDSLNPGEDCVWPNIKMKDGFVVLWEKDTAAPHVVATAFADPVTGEYHFDNVPPGKYKIFTSDYPIDFIWQELQVTVQPSTDVTGADLAIPRFFGRANGFVINDTTGLPVNGAKLNLRLKSGSVWKTTTTANDADNGDGFYLFDNLAEVEVMGHLDVDYHTLPSNLRGVMEEICHIDPADTSPQPALICNSYDGSNQDIGWFTANYRANLHVEEIPADEGYIIGSVFNDHLSYDAATSSWQGNGTLDEGEDRLLTGVTINLRNGPIDITTGLASTVVATTTTGSFSEDVAGPQGHIQPYTAKEFVEADEFCPDGITPTYKKGDLEVDEWGGIFKGPRLGQFEFRGVAPGTYQVEVVLPNGFSPATPDIQTITVVGGQRNDVDFGASTQVALAGEIEGGVFDDVFIDNFHQSILWMEKQGIPGAPVGIYDHLGYRLGQGFMGHPYCYTPEAPPELWDTPGVRPCPVDEVLGQKPEVERRAAPGVHIYLGNDPALPGYNSDYVPMALNYTFGQGRFKFEADWSLLPTAFTGGLEGAAVLPADAPVIGGGGAVVKNYGPEGGEIKNAVYNGTDGLKIQFVGEKKKKKKKKHSKHKAKDKAGYKGGKHKDKDDNGKDDHDDEMDSHHDENHGHGGGADTTTPYVIDGYNFGSEQGHSTVSLSGQELNVTAWSDTQITVQIPSTAIPGPMIVATTNGISNSLDVAVTSPTPAWAAYLADSTIYVDDDAMVGAGDGSSASPFATITEAMNNLPAARPVNIMVAPGKYNENVHVTESDIKIIGAGPFASMIDGLDLSAMNPITGTQQGTYSATGGAAFFIGKGGMDGAVSNVMISGFTITGGTPGGDGTGGGIFADYGNTNIDINNNIMGLNGGEYGGAIWLHKTNHDVRIWSNLIAENGNFGGYGGGISVNDEPEYGPHEPALDHSYDDSVNKTPPGTYEIFNNLIFHNYSPDYGGGIALYEVKDQLNVYGNVIMENRSDDHGGGIFFEDTGPVNVYDNVFLRNICMDDGGAISFEDVGDDISVVKVYNNLFAENIADDRSENSARGGAISFDDTLQAEVYNNTITGNIVAGTFDPTGGAIDSERHGHEYDATSTAPKPPYFSDVKVYNNVIWNNYRLFYDITAGEDLDYRWGTNYDWTVNNIHVDDPAVNQPWETDVNSEALSLVEYNDIEGGEYATRTGNISMDPAFVATDLLDWHLLSTSPVIGQANASSSPTYDLDLIDRTTDGAADMGALEFRTSPAGVIRVPADLLGAIEVPVYGTIQLHPPTP
ncbi:MAG: IPT/TIG domain-containing protein [Thermodesulfobacteriota bacterium]